MKRHLFILLLVITPCFILSCQKKWEDRCAEEAKKVTETQCPRDVGDGIMLDSMAYKATDNRFIYYYSVSGELDNPEIFQKSRSKMEEALNEQLNNSIELKPYKEHSMSFTYIYQSAKSKTTYLNCTFTPEQYK